MMSGVIITCFQRYFKWLLVSWKTIKSVAVEGMITLSKVNSVYAKYWFWAIFEDK